jgi:hypothetical protein
MTGLLDFRTSGLPSSGLPSPDYCLLDFFHSTKKEAALIGCLLFIYSLVIS